MRAHDLFGKRLDQITFDDVVGYFSVAREETATLEFKSGGMDLKDILKEVSALLNTDGGVIILGAPRESRTERNGQEVKYCIGDPDRCHTIKSKTALLQFIATGIAPRPVGIEACEINTGSGSVFILEITASKTPPHQVVHESRYYIRIKSNSVPAPHEVVKALFFRDVTPSLYVSVTHVDGAITITLSNESSTPAEKPGLSVEVFGVHNVRAEGRELVANPDANSYVDQAVIPAVLPRGLEYTHRLDIRHGAPYALRTSYWSDRFELRTFYWVIDSEVDSIVRYDPTVPADLIEVQAFLTPPEQPLKRV